MTFPAKAEGPLVAKLIGTRLVEEPLKAVHHDVGDAASGLIRAHGESEFGVLDGERRTDKVAVETALEVLALVADNAGVAALAARGRDGEDDAQRQGLRGLGLVQVEVEGVAVVIETDADRFGDVDDAAPADGQHAVDRELTRHFDARKAEAFVGVGGDAAEIVVSDAGFVEDLNDAPIKAACLDGAAPIDKENVLKAVFL
jgi:hypothetical protein